MQFAPEVREAHPALTVTDVLSFVGSADVNFGDSGPRDTPQWYLLEQKGEAPGKLTALEVVLLDTASVVRRVAFQD